MRERLLAAFYSPSVVVKLLMVCVIALGLAGATWAVYATGGVKFAIVHVMYAPVIIAALVFGTAGGIATGAVAGLLLGPYMPIDTATGEAQPLANWLYRTGFFCLFGALVGAGAGALRGQLKKLAWLNDHDAKTGLLDETGLLKALRTMIGEKQQGGVFLIVAQMNNFLDVRNTLGPAFGEQLLKQICERGRRLMPPDVSIALIQADRLAAAFTNGPATQQLRTEFETRTREPYVMDGVPVYIDFAIGAAECPTHARTAEELLQKASIAMHTAVTNKRTFCLYDSTIDHTSRDNLVLLGLIPAAIANKEFQIWHQAKISLATGKVSGTEALLRWSHPQRGLIPPGNFIPQAEETELINDLTQLVIQSALSNKATWAQWTEHGRAMSIAINLSVRNLRDRVLLETLHQTVLRYGIEPRQVELEITESAVMDAFDYCGQLITELRGRGYRVSIDDFGTGNSSLAYLKKLPVSALKIDQVFVKNLAHDASDQKIVRTMLSLAQSLDLETIAEGVEDEAALALLRDWGCNYAQGFGLHRPAPYDKVFAWLKEQP